MTADRDPRHRVLDLVLELGVLVEDDMTRGLAAVGLTRSRAHLLFEVAQRGPSTQQTLAGALGVAPRTVTGLVDGVVAGGLVTREPHPHDRRATLVTLTAQGRAVADGLVRGRVDFAEALVGDLPAERVADLVEALAEVVERLRRLTTVDARADDQPGAQPDPAAYAAPDAEAAP